MYVFTLNNHRDDDDDDGGGVGFGDDDDADDDELFHDENTWPEGAELRDWVYRRRDPTT